MNEFAALPPAAEFNVAPSAGGPTQPHENPFEIFHRIHRLLRGRYVYVCVFGAIGAIAGAVFGFKSTVPKYQSVGMIRVKSPRALVYSIQDIQSNNGYVRSIAQLLQDPAVLNLAMQSDDWKKLGRGFTDDARDEFRDSLRVETDPGANEWIYVKFTDPSPEAAQIGAEQVIIAYKDKHGSEDAIIGPDTLEKLKQKADRYDDDIHELQKKINDIAPFGASNLDSMYKDAWEEYRALDRQVSQTKAQIDLAEKSEDPAEAQPPAEPDLDAVAAEMAKNDEAIRGLILHLGDTQSYLDRLIAQGFTEEHPAIIKQRAAVRGLQGQIRAQAKKWIEQHGGIVPGVEGAQPKLTPEQLETAKAFLATQTERREAAGKAAAALNEARSKVNDLNERIKKTEATKADVERRQAELNTESMSMSATPVDPRINIISKGELPHRPFSDNRKKFAAFGFLLGGGFPLGIILLWGLLDRRYRYSDDASSGPVHPTLLGILPYLPDDMSDPEQAAIAAHCVHQIRTLLQISAAQLDKRVFAVTSPTSGDGKTSLSMSLALSFASSGANTCLIDFDLIGCGLTSAMNAKTELGVMQAVEHGELNGQIRQTGFNRLSLVPAGSHDASLVATLSPESVRRIIQQAREKFDVVVIDTGPILGSLEASLVTSAADGVILALGRGQARMLADRAIKHLGSVGATLLGVVFNRAQPGDFRRTISSASVRSVPNQGGPPPMDNRSLPALGPMARTVARQARQSSDPHAE